MSLRRIPIFCCWLLYSENVQQIDLIDGATQINSILTHFLTARSINYRWRVLEVSNYHGGLVYFSLRFCQFLPHVFWYFVVKSTHNKECHVLKNWPLNIIVVFLALKSALSEISTAFFALNKPIRLINNKKKHIFYFAFISPFPYTFSFITSTQDSGLYRVPSLSVCCAPCTCGLVYVASFRKFSAITASDIPSAPSVFSLPCCGHVYVTPFVIDLQFLDIPFPCPKPFFSLNFSFGKLLLLSQYHCFFIGCVQYIETGNLPLCDSAFNFLISFGSSL